MFLIQKISPVCPFIVSELFGQCRFSENMILISIKSMKLDNDDIVKRKIPFEFCRTSPVLRETCVETRGWDTTIVAIEHGFWWPFLFAVSTRWGTETSMDRHVGSRSNLNSGNLDSSCGFAFDKRLHLCILASSVKFTTWAPSEFPFSS